MVTYWNGITGKTKDIPYPSGVGEEKLGLESQAVTVTAGHLQNRLAISLLNRQAAAKGRKSHY